MKVNGWARNVLILILAVSFGAVAAIAQEPQTKDSSGDGSKGKAVTVTGCLQKGDEAGEYSITGEDGKHYGLLGQSGVDLSKHVGHKVSVTGTEMREKGEGKEKDEAGSKEEDVHLKVSGIKHISETCQ